MSGKADLPHGDRFEEGKEHSHQAGDSKDQRSIANRLAAEERKDENAGDSKETALSKEDPTLPVRPLPQGQTQQLLCSMLTKSGTGQVTRKRTFQRRQD